jgi:hypothetical protein
MNTSPPNNTLRITIPQTNTNEDLPRQEVNLITVRLQPVLEAPALGAAKRPAALRQAVLVGVVGTVARVVAAGGDEDEGAFWGA